MAVASDQTLYGNVLSSMRDGVLAVDLHGQLLIINEAAGNLLDLDPKGLIGRPLAEALFDQAGLASLADTVIDAVFEHKEISRTEIEVEVRGAQAWFAVTTHLLQAPEDESGLVVVITDITTPKRHGDLKRLFGTFLDPRIVEQLEGDPENASRGTNREMTVLFSDLQGFTRMTESLPAADLVRLINRHLGETARIIRAHGGVVDKFMGDGVMAFWGPPFMDPEEGARAACASALEQLEAVAKLPDWAASELPGGEGVGPIGLRIGIATGQVVSGSVGSDDARSYTVMGDPVNVAARLEAYNKELGTRVLVNGETERHIDGHFAVRDMGQITLRGRQQAETVFELQGLRDDQVKADRDRARAYAAAMAAFRDQRYPDAIAGFASCVASDAGDKGARRMLSEAIRMADQGR